MKVTLRYESEIICMAKQSSQRDDYRQLTDELKSGKPANCYIFYGDERFLLERSVQQLRNLICPEGTGSFNYRQFDGKTVSVDEIEAAVDTYPAFTERTLIEVTDYNMFAAGGKHVKFDDSQIGESDTLQTDDSDDSSSAANFSANFEMLNSPDETASSSSGRKKPSKDAEQRLVDLICDLPEYVCLVFIFDLITFKPDLRRKNTSAILKHTRTIEFSVQSTDRLTKWIVQHFKDAGKMISSSDAAYLSFITGGLMYSLLSEIEKVSAYASGPIITRSDIDAVVTPILDTVAYKLTDSLIRREFETAMRILDELFRMREPAHKIMYAIAVKMRQLLAARICLENNLDKSELIRIIALPKNLEFQAGYLMDTARKTTLTRCRNYVLLCSEAGYALNSRSNGELRITELMAQLAFAPE